MALEAGCSCEPFESGPSRLAVRGEDSEPAHGSAQGMRLGQDQADCDAPHQRILEGPKVCLARKTRADHNVRRLELGGEQDHEDVHQRRREVLTQALYKLTTQQLMALSSGEAELYGILKGATQTKGFTRQTHSWTSGMAACWTTPIL